MNRKMESIIMKNTKNIRNSKLNITRGMFLSMLLVLPSAPVQAVGQLDALLFPNSWHPYLDDLEQNPIGSFLMGNGPLYFATAATTFFGTACYYSLPTDKRNLLGMQTALLRMAGRTNNVTGAKCLLGLCNGGDVINNSLWGYTPFEEAIQKGHVEIAELFIKHGADINKADDFGCTPLLAAFARRHTAIVELLLAHGADVNKADGYGQTPLYVASSCGHTAIVKLLLAHGADINLVNGYHTLLYIASMHGHTAIVELLLAHGVDVNKINFEGNAPLYVASICARTPIVELLLAYGADQSQVDLAQVTNVDCRNALQEAKTVWKHRDKFCQADRDGNINLFENSKLLTAIKALSPDDRQLIIDTYPNTDQTKVDALIEEHQCSILDAQIMVPIIEITQKYLNLLNASDYAKDRLKNRHRSELSNHLDIKTVKTLLARKGYEGKADGASLSNGSISKLPIELLAYNIGSFLAPDEQTLLDPLLAQRSDAIRNRMHDEIIVDEDTTAALADTEYEAAVNRLKPSLTCSQDGNGNVSDTQARESIVRKRK